MYDLIACSQRCFRDCCCTCFGRHVPVCLGFLLC